MTKKEIIAMAREAWLSDKEAQLITEFDEAYISCTYLQDLEKFAALVASAEREACAKVCEEFGKTSANMSQAWRNGCLESATEIRARGQA